MNSAKQVVVFGEIYSANVGDGLIFNSIKAGLEARGIRAIPADLSLRTEYTPAIGIEDRSEVGMARTLARTLTRRSLSVRRFITVASWIGSGRQRFIDRYTPLVRASDGVVIGGGQLLTDRELAFPLRIREIVAIAKAERKPLAIFSCGADTRQGVVARRFLHDALRYARHVSVRDEASQRFLAGLEIGKVVQLSPDIAFMTPQPKAASDRNDTVGINIMPYNTLMSFAPHGTKLREPEARRFWNVLVERCLAEGWKVALVTNGDPRDGEAAKKIYETFKDRPAVSLKPPPSDPAELLAQLNDFRALVACRMHAGIAAYTLGKTVVPMGWDSKVRGVWSAADPEVPVHDYYAISENMPDSIVRHLSLSVGKSRASDVRLRLSSCLDALAAVF